MFLVLSVEKYRATQVAPVPLISAMVGRAHAMSMPLTAIARLLIGQSVELLVEATDLLSVAVLKPRHVTLGHHVMDAGDRHPDHVGGQIWPHSGPEST